MSERDLFDRAARDMRPEFRARLHDLIEVVAVERDDAKAEAAATFEPEQVVIELAPTRVETEPTRRSNWLLVAAASVAVVVGVGLLVRSEDEITGVSSAPESVPAEAPGCNESTSDDTTELSIETLPGGGFCLVLGQLRLPVGIPTDATVPSDPELVESGPIPGTSSWYYVFAVPPQIAVNDVADEFGDSPMTAASQIGRRLLIVEPDVDGDGPHVTRSWTLSSGDDLFGTISATGPLPAAHAASSVETQP